MVSMTKTDLIEKKDLKQWPVRDAQLCSDKGFYGIHGTAMAMKIHQVVLLKFGIIWILERKRLHRGAKVSSY